MTTDEIVQLLLMVRVRLLDNVEPEDEDLIKGLEKLIPLIKEFWG